MKITFKNTALGVIFHPDTYDFGFPPQMINNGRELSSAECRKLGLGLLDKSSSLKKLCSDIQLVKRSFWEAYAKGRHKLADIITSVEIEEGGILITEGTPFTHTYFYYVRTFINNGEWDYDLLFMDFSKAPSNDCPHLDVFISNSSTSQSSKSAIWKPYLDEGKDRAYWASMIIGFVVFKKYCDIETKIIEGTTRRTIVNGTKYVNDTDKRIQVLDCTWFTNLVSSGAFGVTGHLRWQWCGPGRTEKQLVYVHEYEKKGYMRKAKASISPNNNKKQNHGNEE